MGHDEVGAGFVGLLREIVFMALVGGKWLEVGWMKRASTAKRADLTAAGVGLAVSGVPEGLWPSANAMSVIPFMRCVRPRQSPPVSGERTTQRGCMRSERFCRGREHAIHCLPLAQSKEESKPRRRGTGRPRDQHLPSGAPSVVSTSGKCTSNGL